jgi:small subunit ribosomal protein S20
LAIRSALKRWRQSEKKHLRNKDVKSEVKTYYKKVLAAIESKNKEEAASAFKKVASLYDRAVRKGIIRLNNAARSKSRLAAKLNQFK